MGSPSRFRWLDLGAALFFGATGGSTLVQAQPAGSIHGTVTDDRRNPLVGAIVRTTSAGGFATTDQTGRYRVAGVGAGEVLVIVSYIGFRPDTVRITVRSGEETAADALLQPLATALPELSVIAGRARGDALALNEQKEAPNLVNVVSAEVITSLPNTNVADAIGRLPGVTLERDEGEGKYVQIRGTEPRLSNVTIDGVHVPAPEGGARNVKLDVIPSDLIGTIELNKTLSADLDGDAIGGSVNLVTKRPGDRPTYSIGGLGGYTNLQGGRSLYQVSGTFGQRFGADHRLGLMIGGTYDWNGRGIDDVEPVVSTFNNCGGTGATAVWCGGEDYRRYQYQRSRIGFAGALDYRLGPASSVYIRGLFSGFRNYGFRWATSPAPGSFLTATQTNQDGTTGAGVQNRQPNEQIYDVVAGGAHDLGGARIDYSASLARSRQDRTNQRTTSFASTFSDVAYKVDFPDGVTPRFVPMNGRNINDPTTYVLDGSTLNNDHTFERDLAAAVNVSLPYRAGHGGVFKVGAKIRSGHKEQSIADQFFSGDEATTMDHMLATFSQAGYYKSQYPLGPVPDYDKTEAYLASHPSVLSLNATKGHLRNDPNNYVAAERVAAAYAMNTVEFGPVLLQAGVRLEHTSSDYTGNKVLVDTQGHYTSTQPVTGGANYTNVLPSIQVRYAIDGLTNLRAAVGAGIARPVIGTLVPFATENDKKQEISAGNPTLKPTKATNLDLLVEHYFASVGVISAGAFYKDLRDPIYPGVASVITSGTYAGYAQVRAENGPKAHLYGVELAWQQQLTSLPGALSGLGILANYTHAWSRALFPDGAGRTDKPSLLRQAPDLFNVGLTYDRDGFSARAALTYNGPSIFQYNYQDGVTGGTTGPNGDIYLYSRSQIDAQVSYRLHSGLEFYANGLNLNNAVFGFYQGASPYTIQREYYGPSVSFGARVRR